MNGVWQLHAALTIAAAVVLLLAVLLGGHLQWLRDRDEQREYQAVIDGLVAEVAGLVADLRQARHVTATATHAARVLHADRSALLDEVRVLRAGTAVAPWSEPRPVPLGGPAMVPAGGGRWSG